LLAAGWDGAFVDSPNVGSSISKTSLSPGGFDSIQDAEDRDPVGIIPHGEVVAFQIRVDSEDAI
jgi:hypothetical protein